MRASTVLGLLTLALAVGGSVFYLGAPAWRGHLSALTLTGEAGAELSADGRYTYDQAKAILGQANSLRGRPAWCLDTFLWTYQSQVRRSCEGRKIAAHIGTKCDIKARGAVNTAVLDLALRTCSEPRPS